MCPQRARRRAHDAGALARGDADPARLGAERFVEVGPGRVLTGLAKRTLSGVELVMPERRCSRPAPALPAGLTLRAAAIAVGGTALPDRRVTSAELADRLGVTEDWIVTRTGIRERRQAGPDERLSDYATRAGAQRPGGRGGGCRRCSIS